MHVLTSHMRDSRRHRRERGRSGARSNGNRPAKNASRKSCGSCLTTRVGGRETCDRRVRVEGSEGCAESGRWRATRRLTRANSGAFEAHTLRARTCTPAPLPKALIGARSDERLLRHGAGRAGRGAKSSGGGERSGAEGGGGGGGGGGSRGDDLRTREPTHSSSRVHQGEESTCAALEEMRGEHAFEKGERVPIRRSCRRSRARRLDTKGNRTPPVPDNVR